MPVPLLSSSSAGLPCSGGEDVICYGVQTRWNREARNALLGCLRISFCGIRRKPDSVPGQFRGAVRDEVEHDPGLKENTDSGAKQNLPLFVPSGLWCGALAWPFARPFG